MPAIAAVLVAVIGGGIMLTRSSDQGVVGAPSASPSSSPSAAAPTTVPTTLLGRWMGGSRSVPSLQPGVGTSINFTEKTFGLSQANLVDNPLMVASASATTDGGLRLSNTAGCVGSDAGDYAWTLSDDGRHLTITAVSDPCAARLATVPGDWVKMGCKNPLDGCLGDLAPGTYASQYIDPRLEPGASWKPVYGAVTYSVPDGWANSADWPDTFTVTPSDAYATETKDGPAGGHWHAIGVWAQPAAVTQDGPCSEIVDTKVPRTVDGLMGYITSLPSLDTTPSQPITIDGHQGRWTDVRLRSDWTGRCPDTAQPSTAFLKKAGGDAANGWSFGLLGPERSRLVLLDLGGGDIVLVFVDDGGGDRFDQLATDAMPIIESMTFK